MTSADRNNRRPVRVPMSAVVRSTQQLSPTMVRIVLGGDDLSRFEPSESADSYVKVMFLHPDAVYERPIDVNAIRESHPSEHWPRLRTYTVRAWDAAAQELTLDFVVHGTQGLAGPWAAAAATGDEVLLLGPGGGYSPASDADWHLLVGDESALPAIAVSLEQLSNDAVARVFIEVHGPDDELPLTAPAKAEIRWIHRGDRPIGERLVDAVSQSELPAGDVHAFVHGEAGAVKQLRRLLKVERGIDGDRLSLSGYWRLGNDDEGWRAAKREWNASVEAEEAATTSS